MFGSARDYLAALKVATYGAIPVLLAGATLVMPAMAIVGMVGTCHTLFLYWLGVHRVLKVPAGGGAEFVGISIDMAKRTRNDFFPKASVDPDRIVGLDTIVPDAVGLKYTAAPLSKEQLAELIQIPPRQ